jgi:tRNA A37 threonylcarbamoyladenosine modification protein TsaB
MMDARRNQVYTGLYRFEGENFRILQEQTPMAVADLAEQLNQRGEKVVFLGDGVPVYRELLAELLKVPYQVAPAHLNRQRASAVAVLAMQYVREGRIETAADHVPDYLRLSQAERERAEALKKAAAAEEA